MITDKELFIKIIDDKESKSLYERYNVSSGLDRLKWKRLYEERKLYIFQIIKYTCAIPTSTEMKGGLTKMKAKPVLV
jgi:hypothetical protein